LKIYEITIKPVSGFGTPLKGDTIFGHFCWQIAYDETLLGCRINDLLSSYNTKPFAVFSSAYPKFCDGKIYHYALKTPDLPSDQLFPVPDDMDNRREMIKKRKEYKAKRWMMIKEGEKFSSFRELEFLNDDKLLHRATENLTEEMKRRMRKIGSKGFISAFSQPRNTINRLTGTTGEGRFAPFNIDQDVYYPETELALFVGIDETVTDIDRIKKILERIGSIGFGKDASTGLGRFELGGESEIVLSEIGSKSPNACYTLAPCVPEKGTFSEMFFAPFTRFGRHGDILAKSSNPFKNPVIMADEGGVFIPKGHHVFEKPYIGRAITNVSKALPNTVTQGYSLYIPVSVEVQ
jgi:CRISPR-associated protein Csm4